MTQQSVASKNVGARITTLMKKNVPFLILLSLLILFSFMAPNFMTFGNLRILIRQVSFSGIAAVGLMFVMISGGIDLSIGSQVVLTNVLLAIMMVYGKMDPVVAIPLILGVGLLLGMINGLLSITLKIHPLIITLGTAAIYKGIGYIINASRNIMGFPDSFRWLGQGYVWGIPVPVIVWVIVALIGAFVLNKTYFGRRVYALGGNEEAARLAGVRINRMKVFLFMICGFTAAITSVLLFPEFSPARRLQARDSNSTASPLRYWAGSASRAVKAASLAWWSVSSSLACSTMPCNWPAFRIFRKQWLKVPCY